MKIPYSENPSMWRNNPLGVIVCILLIPVFGIGLLILLLWYAFTKATLLEIHDGDIILEKGLLNKTRIELSARTVRSVRVYQSLLDRFFGVGRIDIFTAGDAPEITASGMPEPHTVRDLIKAHKEN